MLKVIDLDAQGKEDGLVFTLTIAGEKFGITDQELVELLRARAGVAGGKQSGKKPPARRGASQSETPANEGGGEQSADPDAETTEAAAH